MNRRGFLQKILAAGIAPAVIGSGILMPVRELFVPDDEIAITHPMFKGEIGHFNNVRIWSEALARETTKTPQRWERFANKLIIVHPDAARIFA